MIKGAQGSRVGSTTVERMGVADVKTGEKRPSLPRCLDGPSRYAPLVLQSLASSYSR